MNFKLLELVPPNLKYEKSFRAGFSELETEADKLAWIYLGELGYSKYFQVPFSEYVQMLLDRETQPSVGFVCDTVYWGVCENEVVGRISIRHELNEFLKKFGGHIGYIVRPSFRGHGLATEMLKRALLTNRAQTIGQLLLTCDDNNLASEKVIRKAGGVFQDSIEIGPDKARKKRFWIMTN